jgi:uncharacterized protein (DUF2267 family)
MDDEEFLAKVVERAGLPREQAEALTRATLEVLADRISGGEARDLARELPEPLKEWLRPLDELAKGYGPHSFVRRVRDRAGVTQEVAEAGVRAVIATLREAIRPKEFRDATAQLPKEYEPLLTWEPSPVRGER